MSTFWAEVSTPSYSINLPTPSTGYYNNSMEFFTCYITWMTFLLQAQQALTYVIRTCLRCAVELVPPIKAEKVERPTTCLTFLGIVLDTVTMEASISSASLLTAIRSYCSLRKCIQNGNCYLSLANYLLHAKWFQ